jgi:hypothetical protein
MGRFTSAARYVSPVNRAAFAMWAWRHRDEIFGWAAYATNAVPRLASGDASDVITEGRLRARLTADGRTRTAKGLDVAVVDGVAELRGRVDVDVADVAREIALDTTGVRRVRDELTAPKKRRGRA